MKIIRNTFSTSLSKRLLISLLAIGMASHLTGCAMGGSSDEGGAGGDETFAEESSGDFAEGDAPAEGEEGATDGDLAAEGEAGSDDLGGEVAEGDGSGGETDGDVAAAPEDGGDDLALDGEVDSESADGGDVAMGGDDELSLDDEEGLPSDIASNDAGAEPAPIIDEPAAPPTDAPVFADPVAETAEATPPPVSEPAAWIPLKKVKSEAFMAGSANLNRVYVARPGETRPGISEKIYGDKSHSKDLLKWNGFLSRGVKTGDKIYYTSPTNPTDTAMLTYYEDVGVPAQNYVSRDGDNIREVATTLLGDKDSWKEIWATNADIESKGKIPAGLNIRYWPDGSAPAPAPVPTLAQNDPPPVDPAPVGMDPLAQQQPPMGTQTDPLAQPPADPLAPNDPVAMQGDQPPPLNDPLAQPTGTPASIPPAVGSTDPQIPPPVDPPVSQSQSMEPKNSAAMGEGGAAHNTEEADNMMMMGLGGIVLLAAGAVFFLMRRSRSRKVDLTQTTQVG
jgi:hypothetical protein